MADLGVITTGGFSKIPYCIFGSVFTPCIPGYSTIFSIIQKNANKYSIINAWVLTSTYGMTTKTSKSVHLYNFPAVSVLYRSNKPISLIVPFWIYDTFVPMKSGDSINGLSTSGTISGVVKVENVIRSNMIVRLYYKRNGRLIASTLTNSNGAFTFYGLEAGKAYYTVLAFNSEEGFNAIAMDSITPV